MLPFQLKTLVIAYSMVTPFFVFAQSTQNNIAEDIERVSVYGRQNSVVLDSGLATKSNLSLMETPAAVVVVDKDLIDVQGVTDLQSVIHNVSGVTQAGNNYGIGDYVVIRGLDANYTFDGMYGGAGLSNSFNPTRSFTNVESVEVLKGPATGLYGMGNAGGVINLIEKKPQFNSAHQLNVELGAWGTYSLAIDSTAALTDELAYRINAKSARSDGYRGLGTDRDEIYSSLKYIINDQQDLLFSAAFIKDSIAVDSVGDPVRIFNTASVGGKTAAEITWQDLNDPNLTVEQRKQLADSLSAQDGLRPYELDGTGLISPLSKDNTGQEMRFKIQHTLDMTDDIYFNQQLQYREYDTDFTRQTGAYNYVYWNRNGQINQSPRGPLVEDGVLYPFAARRQEYRQVDAQEQSWQYFADLSYQFEVAGFDHELLVNANVEDRQIRLKQYSVYDNDKKIFNADNELIYQGQLDYIYDIRNPNFNQGQFEDYDPLLTSNYKKGIRAWGIGIQDVAYWGDSFITRVGVAYNTIGQSYQHLGVDARYSASRAQAKPQADTSDDGMTYNLGATYLINDDISLFANHAKGRTAYSVLGSIDSAESRREDSTSVSNDIGLRFKALDDQLLASIVVFDSGNTNLRYANPEFEAGVTPDEPEYYYNGEEKTKGIEIDLNAHINSHWLINLNGTVQDARDKKNPNRDSFNTRQKGIPRITGSAWISYELSTDNPLTLSLGAEYVDKRTINSAGFGVPDAELPSYTIMNSSIRYEWQDVTLQLNINNIFDTHYYQKALFLGGLPGEPRNASFTIKYEI